MFKNQLNPTKIILSGACLFLLLMGCQATVNQGSEAVLTTATIVSEQGAALQNAVTIVPTRSILQTATSTSTPIPTATSSPTVPPTQTPLPTPTVTPTPWPTLPPDEAADKVLALLADNQNPDCLLPCWWGATPGQSLWQDIEPFLNSFSLVRPRTIPSAASVKLPLPEPVAVSNHSYYIYYSWDEFGIIQVTDIDSMNVPGYDPQTMMTLYGVPDEVWLKTFSELLPGEVLPFQLIIVYQEKGISFRYYLDASGTDETVTACFEPGMVETERPDLFPVGPRIYLWAPGQHKTIDEIANIPGERYFPLEEKTDLTPQALYEKFTDPNEQPCIDTPADLWMDP
ncbi:MAG: hypothetical protein KF770_27415 [Anaerolineae bacterium]|nr:hypothetical protein [Anaerolineae bacterium]